MFLNISISTISFLGKSIETQFDIEYRYLRCTSNSTNKYNNVTDIGAAIG